VWGVEPQSQRLRRRSSRVLILGLFPLATPLAPGRDLSPPCRPARRSRPNPSPPRPDDGLIYRYASTPNGAGDTGSRSPSTIARSVVSRQPLAVSGTLPAIGFLLTASYWVYATSFATMPLRQRHCRRASAPGSRSPRMMDMSGQTDSNRHLRSGRPTFYRLNYARDIFQLVTCNKKARGLGKRPRAPRQLSKSGTLVHFLPWRGPRLVTQDRPQRRREIGGAGGLLLIKFC
jgi:hypothetical protein